MPTKLISFTNFNRRLWLAGGRDQTPPGSLRQAVGVAPESTSSIMSRWGSLRLFNVNAKQMYRYNGHRYAYDGTQLYQDGVSIRFGFNGTPLAFNTMPPQVGLPDYLFICGGGTAPFKISPTGTISNWGIQPPKDGMQGIPQAADNLSIETFIASHTHWTGTNATIADSTTTPTPFNNAASCLEVAPSNTQLQYWYITKSSLTLDLTTYGDGRRSLLTDLIQFYAWFSDPTKIDFLSIQFDVNDGNFTDYYQANIQIIPGSTNPYLTAGVQAVITPDAGRWTQFAIAKQAFFRQGAHFNLDWSTVVAIRIAGGLPYGGSGVFVLGLQNLKLTGSYGLGTGPQAALGGSTYLYQQTFGSDVTGSDSNPNLQPLVINGVAEGPVALSQIQLSPDPQVTNRKLWRSSALPLGSTSGPLFYLTTIHDNTTTTFTDTFADQSVPYTATYWVASSAFIANQLIDGGNGWLFKVTAGGGGNSGATAPAWNAPGGYWIGLFNGFNIGDTIWDPYSGFILQVTTTGITGKNIPNFAVLSIGEGILDGTLSWVRIAAPTTVDNVLTWTFQGANSVPTLGNQQVLLDNTPPSSTFNAATGPFQGSMAWAGDTAAGFQGNTYFSPPGRPESVGVALQVTSTTDPAIQLARWDVGLWVFSNLRVLQIAGTYPAFQVLDVDNGLGTNAPQTVVATQSAGVLYNAVDGMRQLNFSGSQLVGFENISPVLRGQGEENVPAFVPTWAALGRDELYFGNNSIVLALSYVGGELTISAGTFMWRELGPAMLGAFYERDTGSVMASWGGNVYLYEQNGQQSDDGTAIPFIMQSPGEMPDPGAQFLTQRLYLTAQLNGQNLTPTLIVDGQSHTLPFLVGTERKTIEMPIQVAGRLFDGVQLTGDLTGRVEVFRIEVEVWLGEVQ